MTVTQPIFAYPANVYQNNIIPIIPDLTSDDPRLTSYNCTNISIFSIQYQPSNNIVHTDTIRDWLYFAANLRGGALETINVPYLLQPLVESTLKD